MTRMRLVIGWDIHKKKARDFTDSLSIHQDLPYSSLVSPKMASSNIRTYNTARQSKGTKTVECSLSTSIVLTC